MISKIAPLAIFSILAVTGFAQDSTNTKPLPKPTGIDKTKVQNQMMSGYNAPSRNEVRGSWDVFASGSFIYWQTSQDNMDIAFVDKLSNDSFLNDNQTKGSFSAMSFGYHPGFEVALGINLDRDYWDSCVNYTMLHGESTKSVTAFELSPGNPAPLFQTWGQPLIGGLATNNTGKNVYNTATQSWRSNLDIIDLDLGRKYFVGSQLTMRTGFGLRSAWIRQSLYAGYVNTTFDDSSSGEIPGELDVYFRTHSWSIGPRASVDSNWILGQGFRLFGNAETDILYTQYKVQTKTTFLETSSGDTQYFIGKQNVTALRPHADLELGFGWGSYFDNNNWYIDLSAAYGFQVFFNQNMFPMTFGTATPGKQLEAAGNLYVQGLTATVRLDF